MNLNLGYITGSNAEMGYAGAYSGGPTINSINTNNTGDQYQQVTATISGFAGDITGFTVGAANGVVVDGTVASGTVTLQLPGDLATGTYNATVFNGTESALISFAFTQTHSYTSPYGLVDSNSAFFDQVLTEFSYHRVAVPFSNGVLDAAGAEADSLWGNDIADIYTPDEGFGGTDTATFEILYADGTTASWAVSVEVVHVYNIIAPYEIVDDNSAFFGQVFDDGTLSRIVTPPSHGVIDVERANNENLWGDDIALIYTPTAGFEGDDSFTMQEKYPNGDIGVVRTVSMVVSSTSAEFSISETIEIVVSATSSKVAKMGIEETVTLTPSVSFKKLAYASLSESLEISEDVTFRSLRYVEAERDVAFDSAATLANEVITHLFAVTEAVSFTVDSTFQVPYTIVPSGVSAGGFTDITSKSSHILTSGEEQEIIPVTQNSWRQLEFPITVNGEAPSDVSGLNFTMYLDGQIFKVFERGSELAYIDGAIFLVLDETFTATLSKYNYQFELWFTDSEDNSFFVMQGEMQIKHTQASFL